MDQNNHRRVNLKKVLIALVALVLGGLAITLVLMKTQPKLFPFIVEAGCSHDEQLLQKYAEGYRLADVAAIKVTNSDILGRSRLNDDITCQYMLMRYELLYGGDNKVLFERYDRVIDLQNNGQVLSKDLDDGVDHQAFIDGIGELREAMKNPVNMRVDG